MEIILLSFHVKDLGVDGLSRVSLDGSNRALALGDFVKSVGATEGFYLSTCNRTEYLLAFENTVPAGLAEKFEFSPKIFGDRATVLRHLLEVSLSKDSVVFGESQILGQFKRAYEQDLKDGNCGKELSPLLNAVIREAKAIRSRIGLTQCHTSISTVAGQQLIRSVRKNGLPRPLRILFVGAGETNLILARYLKKRIDATFCWTSRTRERASGAAKEAGGEVLDWVKFLEHELPAADVICVATHAREILVDRRTLKNSGASIVCDLAVPANARASDCQELGAEYIGIDKLNEELSASSAVSAQLMVALDSEITNSCNDIESELVLRDSRSVLSGSVRNAESILEQELIKLSLNLSPQSRHDVEEWARRLVKKINHAQLETLKYYVCEDRNSRKRLSPVPSPKRHLGT